MHLNSAKDLISLEASLLEAALNTVNLAAPAAVAAVVIYFLRKYSKDKYIRLTCHPRDHINQHVHGFSSRIPQYLEPCLKKELTDLGRLIDIAVMSPATTIMLVLSRRTLIRMYVAAVDAILSYYDYHQLTRETALTVGQKEVTSFHPAWLFVIVLPEMLRKAAVHIEEALSPSERMGHDERRFKAATKRISIKLPGVM